MYPWMQGCYVRVADWVYAHTVGILVMAAVIAVVEVSRQTLHCRVATSVAHVAVQKTTTTPSCYRHISFLNVVRY